MPVGDSLIDLKDQIPKEKEIYIGLLREMVLDDMVKRKIKEKQLDNRGNIRHALKHLEDKLTLQQLHAEMHEKDRIPVGEVEIQQYYDENRSRFGDRPLYKARDEIKQILASQKENDYVANYISELKDAATITKNYEILRVPEPGEQELREVYEKNKETYREPEKWIIKVILMADTTVNAGDNAQRAWAKLGSGERFASVAKTFGKDSTFSTMEYIIGARAKAFDEAVASLNPGEYSKPFQDNGKYFIVRLTEKIPAADIPFATVRDVIRRLLTNERELKLYKENKDKTLFTLHGRRFTLDDFYQEFRELSPAEQEKHRSYDQRVKLVDSMIERLLLLEDSYDRMLDAKNKEEVEHVREDILKQALHREEVDQKLEVSDEEVKEFYQGNKDKFKTPPKVKVSLIVVQRGDDENADKKAKEKIDEAFKKLKSGFLKKGAPFEQVAGQYSEDSRTAQNGGKVDFWISETGDPLYEMFNHPLHQEIMNLKQGKISKPFPLEQNYLIVKIREKQQPQQQSFEEVKEHLKEDLKLAKHDELTAKMYNDLIDQANLVIYDQVLETIINKQEEVNSSQ
ncbi:MAG: hypothetical protein GWP06_14745 [Actinobacteria bacterium]|nr:hypothetical protein [Actinomycetota bacterium]